MVLSQILRWQLVVPPLNTRANSLHPLMTQDLNETIDWLRSCDSTIIPELIAPVIKQWSISNTLTSFASIKGLSSCSFPVVTLVVA